MQQAFGLRREESMKFQPRYADRGNCIVLKGSWTKGGRPRTVPITTPEQRTVLEHAHRLVGAGSLISMRIAPQVVQQFRRKMALLRVPKVGL
jgi:Integrase